MTTGEKQFEAAIARALEQQPGVTIPADFAARVRASLPSRPRAREPRFAAHSVGQLAAAVAAAGLVVALCLLAPHVRPSFVSVAFDMEMVLLVELCGVTAWLATVRSRS
jgi:hypothetical protein